MKLSIALLAAPALAFAPQAQQARTSVKVEARKEVAAATLGAAALLAPFAAFAGDIESGATIFAGNCAACHAGGNNVIAAEKTLRKEALDSYLTGGRKESSVVTQVTNGKNAMPAFGGRLSDEEIGLVLRPSSFNLRASRARHASWTRARGACARASRGTGPGAMGSTAF